MVSEHNYSLKTNKQGWGNLTLDELQAILHSKPLTTWTPSIAWEMAEDSSKSAYLRLFLKKNQLEKQATFQQNFTLKLQFEENKKIWTLKYKEILLATYKDGKERWIRFSW